MYSKWALFFSCVARIFGYFSFGYNKSVVCFPFNNKKISTHSHWLRFWAVTETLEYLCFYFSELQFIRLLQLFAVLFFVVVNKFSNIMHVKLQIYSFIQTIRHNFQWFYYSNKLKDVDVNLCVCVYFNHFHPPYFIFYCLAFIFLLSLSQFGFLSMTNLSQSIIYIWYDFFCGECVERRA